MRQPTTPSVGNKAFAASLCKLLWKPWATIRTLRTFQYGGAPIAGTADCLLRDISETAHWRQTLDSQQLKSKQSAGETADKPRQPTRST